MAETKKTTTEKKEVKLNSKVWEVPYNQDLISQVVYVYLSNERKGSASAKTRGEVSGGGRKPWRQKGTGRARHGSIRSPLWTKGGVTFVPDFRNWKKKINKRMKNKATSIMLSERLRNKELIFSDIDSKKEFKKVRESLMKEIDKKTLIISSDDKVAQAMGNVKNVNVIMAEKVNAKHLLDCKKVIVDNEIVKVLEERLANGK
jgi:large subunit ribosomal protein L4